MSTIAAWGEALKNARLDRGLSVAKAAEANRMAETTWQNWEAGACTFFQERLLRTLLIRWPEIKRPVFPAPRVKV